MTLDIDSLATLPTAERIQVERRRLPSASKLEGAELRGSRLMTCTSPSSYSAFS